MTNSFPFKVLFWFENDSTIITEIKRTDIQSDDKSLVYKWLVIQKQNESGVDLQSLRTKEGNENKDLIQVLTFRSMSQHDDEQIREFAEGVLSWNTNEVLFNEERLMPVDIQYVTIQWMNTITCFLQQG